MWRILNRLFGWHYVHLSSAGGHEIVRRVRYTADGTAYVVESREGLIYTFDNLIFLNNTSWTVTPLTFPPFTSAEAPDG